MSNSYPRIYLSRTALEWELLQKKVQERGYKNINLYIRSRIKELHEEFKNCPERVLCLYGHAVQKPQYLRIDQFESIAELARRSGVPEGTLVNRLIIEPLFTP